MQENKVTYNDDQWGNQTTEGTNERVEPTVGLYAKRTAKNGRVLHFLNGRLISQDSIPADAVIHDLSGAADGQTVVPPLPDATVEVEHAEVALRDKPCIAGDGPGEYIKFIDGRFISLCESHYNKTSGELASIVRAANGVTTPASESTT